MPKNLKAESCEAAVESALQNIDWCAEAEANNCYQGTENSEIEIEAEDGSNTLQETLDAIEEGRRLARDPNVKGYKSIEELRKALEV